MSRQTEVEKLGLEELNPLQLEYLQRAIDQACRLLSQRQPSEPQMALPWAAGYWGLVEATKEDDLPQLQMLQLRHLFDQCVVEHNLEIGSQSAEEFALQVFGRLQSNIVSRLRID